MILVGFGANLPGRGGAPPRATLAWALGRVNALPGLVFRAASRLWDSAPVPPSGQPRYVNAVAAYAGAAEPASLLAALAAIEAEAGRVRGEPDAARVLDLDLLDLNGLIRDAPAPVLPHPRLAGRGFVLRPLAEVAPAWRHPVSGAMIEVLIAGLPLDEDCRPLA
jgi:2-amino-4-hydroxy-6-hydroxymethyldihydropteridine diphosphokinase